MFQLAEVKGTIKAARAAGLNTISNNASHISHLPSKTM